MSTTPQSPLWTPLWTDEFSATHHALPGLSTSQGGLLAIGVEPARLRLCLLERVVGRYRLAGWLSTARRAELSLVAQAAELCLELERRLRRPLWDEAAHTPFLHSDQPLRLPPIEQLAVTLTPQPCLRVAVLGLTEALSGELARAGVTGGPAQLVHVPAYRREADPAALAAALQAEQVDALVIAGGYDTPPAHPHIHLNELLGYAARGLQLLPAEARPVIYFAGSQWAAKQAIRVFTGSVQISPLILANPMPGPTGVRQSVIAQALHALYARRAQQTQGYAELAAWSNSGQATITVESNFARLVRAWRDFHNLGDLHGVYWSGTHRVHVWTSAREEAIRLRYAGHSAARASAAGGDETGANEEVETETSDWSDWSDWPPVTLFSGQPPPGTPIPSTLRWWDRGGLGPLVTALGPSAPLAVRQALETDILLAPPDWAGASRPRLVSAR